MCSLICDKATFFHYLTVNFYPLLINTSFQHSKVNNHISIKKHFYKILLFINFLFLETGGQHPSLCFFCVHHTTKKKIKNIWAGVFYHTFYNIVPELNIIFSEVLHRIKHQISRLSGWWADAGRTLTCREKAATVDPRGMEEYLNKRHGEIYQIKIGIEN